MTDMVFERGCENVEKRFMNTKATAEYLGCTVSAVRTDVARKRIPYRKKGKKLVFDACELDAFMKRLEGVSIDEAVTRVQNNGALKGFLN
jgi:excisionase family DNA binding protein